MLEDSQRAVNWLPDAFLGKNWRKTRFGKLSPQNSFGELVIGRTSFPHFATNSKRQSASKNPEPSWRNKLGAVRSWNESWRPIFCWRKVSQSSRARRRRLRDCPVNAAQEH